MCKQDPTLIWPSSVHRVTKPHVLSFGKLVQEVALARAQALGAPPKP